MPNVLLSLDVAIDSAVAKCPLNSHMPFGPSTRDYEVLGFGATTHSACTMICGLEDMDHDVE
jgi:hypothetical protein